MGFSIFRPPEYLYQTPTGLFTGLFIFRMKVPPYCKPLLNKNELRYSLKTRCVYSARKHIASILPVILGFFEGIKQGIYTDIPQSTILQIIKESIHGAITVSPGQYKVSTIEPVNNRVAKLNPVVIPRYPCS
jgi:hypothetical protein